MSHHQLPFSADQWALRSQCHETSEGGCRVRWVAGANFLLDNKLCPALSAG